MTNQQSYGDTKTENTGLALALKNAKHLEGTLGALVEIGFLKSALARYSSLQPTQIIDLPTYDNKNQVKGIGDLTN